MEAVLIDLFHGPEHETIHTVHTSMPRPSETAACHTNAQSSSPKVPSSSSASDSPPAYRRTAPYNSLLSRLALHGLVFGNARAVSELWQRYKRSLLGRGPSCCH